MSRRLATSVLLLLAAVPGVFGQARNIFSLPDRIMSSSRIGKVSSRQVPALPTADSSTILFPSKGKAFFSEDFEFFDYLIENGLAKDAETLVRGEYMPSDTLDFARGKVLFSSRRWSQAAGLFEGVPQDSPFGAESWFYKVNSLAFLGEYDLAAKSFPAPGKVEGSYQELCIQQEAALALLRREKTDWERLSGSFTYSDHNLEESERILSEIAVSVFPLKEKRAGVAALASALVPGAGKIYAGRLGEGVASFLSVGSLAAITAENWKRHGSGNWRTVVAGSLAATFYLGNIYGSYLSVSVERNERMHAENAVILYHLHIPVRNTFR